MYMEATLYPDSLSRNVLIELPGTTKPGEYVAVGGHMDSWDNAEGAMVREGAVSTCVEGHLRVRIYSTTAFPPPFFRTTAAGHSPRGTHFEPSRCWD